MQKYIFAILSIIVAMLAIAYFQLFSRQTSYHRSIMATTDSVLILKNFDNSKIRIKTADTDVITIDLEGTEEGLAGLSYHSKGLFTEFGLSGDWSDASGTITVPRGTLLDVTLSGKKSVNIDDASGSKNVHGVDSFLVDTSTLNSFGLNADGELDLNGWGNLIVWDDNNWVLLGDGGGTNPSQEALYCGVGSQVIRNYCCEIQNTDTQATACNGIAHWVFDNSTRVCESVCEANLPPTQNVEVIDVDCGVGSQAARNQCCAGQHAGEYGGCIGGWIYNNSLQQCGFQCDAVGSPSEEQGGGGIPFSYGDGVSDYCVTINGDESRNNCCNDALGNPLSSGPRPGFPDCIGKWKFDEELGCKFTCAEHTEMMQIINEIKQNIQNQQ